jgi:TRAP-type mannitol/chloroaromatic compound transport system permease small subunit
MTGTRESGQAPSRYLARTAAGIDHLVAAIGRAVIWASLLLVVVQFAVVCLRYLLGIGSIWLSESVLYIHATLFLVAAAWTLQQNGHARVDVFYAGTSTRKKAVVDLLGALLLLLPFMAAILWYALPYVARSWSILEHSRETSGLPFVYLLKTLIPVFAFLMALQGVAQAIRAALLLASAPPVSQTGAAVIRGADGL